MRSSSSSSAIVSSKHLFALILAIAGIGMVTCCVENDSCDTCLDANCVWVFLGGCVESCDAIADATCYDPANFPDTDTAGICALVADAEDDRDLCIEQEDCTACVETVLSDGSSTCQWFAEAGLCESACGLDGCGDSTCTESPPPMDAPTNNCGESETCSDCLEAGCAWTNAEGCIARCDMMADASCFQVGGPGNDSVEEVCAVAENAVADEALCAEQEDCGSCVATLLSDGESTCQWFAVGELCQSGCGMDGCGETTCADAEAPTDNCGESNNCGNCLDEGCAWTSVQGCIASCDIIADAACFQVGGPGNENVEDICSVAEEAEADVQLCSEQEDCTSCVGTVLSDGNSTCQWFATGAFCQSGCGMDGCGDTTCIESEPPADACGASVTCTDCLDEGCAWTSVQGCIASCDIIADAACFQVGGPGNENVEDICSVAEEAEVDVQLCSEQQDCGSCVGTVLSDGNSTCQWFASGEFCQSGCGMDGCGDTVCSSTGVPASVCEQYQNCEECLDEACVWSNEAGCLESCDSIADGACFEFDEADGANVTCAVAEEDNVDTSPPQGEEDVDPAPPQGDASSTTPPTSSASQMSTSALFFAISISGLLVQGIL